MSRLSRDEALALFDEPLPALGDAAFKRRCELHGESDVTFVADTNLNYTPVCTVRCRFCSYSVPQGEGSALPWKAVRERLERAVGAGVTTVLLQGGLDPDFGLAEAETLVRRIAEAFPSLHIHAFSPPEIAHFAERGGVTPREALERLARAGMRSMPGGGAEILVEAVRRRISPGKLSAAQWLATSREAHRLGIPTTATMMIGHVETAADVVEHLLAVRALQDETGGFTAFILWDWKPGDSPLSREVRPKGSPVYYLRALAVSRLVLDNVPHLQASWSSQGKRVGQLALSFGADDFGSLLYEEEVMASAGHRLESSVEEMAALVREAGFRPVQRTTDYSPIAATSGA